MLKMEAGNFSQTLRHSYKTAGRHIQQGRNADIHRAGSPKTQTNLIIISIAW